MESKLESPTQKRTGVNDLREKKRGGSYLKNQQASAAKISKLFGYQCIDELREVWFMENISNTFVVLLLSN